MKLNRLNKILSKMQENNIPQMLVTDPKAIFYLTGKMIHPEERLIALYLNTNGNHKLFINELFPVYEDLGVEKVWFDDTKDGVLIISEYIEKEKTIGIDKNWPARFLLHLMELNTENKYVNASFIIDTLRMCKDEEEKDLMKNASNINDMAMEKLQNLLTEDLTEKEIAQRLASIYEELGADGFSFPPIIAYGANGADPHAHCGSAKLKEGDCVILDIGCIKDNYCSDMTRTVFYKEVSQEAKEVYELVKAANEAAEAMIKPGVRLCDIDKTARDLITKAGYGKEFNHRLGHFIGKDVHEYGDVSVNFDLEVQEGMIFSIEPGVYLPGKFGVRIEDLVLVTKDGCKVLNSYTKDLIVI